MSSHKIKTTEIFKIEWNILGHNILLFENQGLKKSEQKL